MPFDTVLEAASRGEYRSDGPICTVLGPTPLPGARLTGPCTALLRRGLGTGADLDPTSVGTRLPDGAGGHVLRNLRNIRSCRIPTDREDEPLAVNLWDHRAVPTVWTAGGSPATTPRLYDPASDAGSALPDPALSRSSGAGGSSVAAAARSRLGDRLSTGHGGVGRSPASGFSAGSGFAGAAGPGRGWRRSGGAAGTALGRDVRDDR